MKWAETGKATSRTCGRLFDRPLVQKIAPNKMEAGATSARHTGRHARMRHQTRSQARLEVVPSQHLRFAPSLDKERALVKDEYAAVFTYAATQYTDARLSNFGIK